MAHKRSASGSRNGRESASKRLGIKKFAGQYVVPGNIIVRQRGTKHSPGLHVGMGRDHTLHALVKGKVAFTRKARGKSFVNVVPV